MSIHLVRKTALAGVATRKAAIILSLESDADVASDRAIKREQVSANLWHLEVRRESPQEVDRELVVWFKKAHARSG